MFNPITYLENLKNTNKLTKTSYKFCKVSGLDNLEEVVSNAKRHKNFIAVDDTDEGVTIKRGGSFYERRHYTVFILEKFKLDDMDDRQTHLESARVIYRQWLAKINKDAEYHANEDLVFFDNNQIHFFEFPGYEAIQATGLYFTFTVENPIELIVDPTDWDE